MKTIRKIMMGAAVGVAIFTTACMKDGTQGGMMVAMTDAPTDSYSEINVDIRAVEVHYNDESKGDKDGWVRLASNAGIYDLLKLQNDVAVVLAEDNSLPSGKVTQLRLILGDENTIVVDGVTGSVTYELTIPSAYQTGIKINIDSDIKSGEKMHIVLDFDAEKSVVVEGDGSFSLKPVIRVESLLQIGS